MPENHPLRLTLIAFALLAACGGGGDAGSEDAPDGGPSDGGLEALEPDATLPADLDELLALYEGGAIDRARLLEGLEAIDDAGADALGVEAIERSTLLRGELTGDAALTVKSGAALVLAPGTTVTLGPEVVLTVEGRFYALGTDEQPVTVRGAGPEARYGTVALRSGPNEVSWAVLQQAGRLLTVEDDGAEPSPTRIAESRFDHWTELAISFDHSDGLRVSRCTFGDISVGDPEQGEAIRGFRSAAVIEGSVFGSRVGYRDAIDLEECHDGHFPLVRGNRFLGGEDDAIDLDGCTAYIVGNLIQHFRPADLSVAYKGVNGGGITGDRDAAPVLIDNVIIGCYHGIGFKNGSTPVLLHNTVIDCNIGLTLYQSAASKPLPSAIAINNIFWNNADWQSGVEQDVVLNGKWWPVYYQGADIQGTLDAHDNIFGVEVEGEGNRVVDPLLDLVDGIPIPGDGSPALGTATSQGLDVTALPWTDVRAYLDQDFLGATRPTESADLGAVQH